MIPPSGTIDPILHGKDRDVLAALNRIADELRTANYLAYLKTLPADPVNPTHRDYVRSKIKMALFPEGRSGPPPRPRRPVR